MHFITANASPCHGTQDKDLCAGSSYCICMCNTRLWHVHDSVQELEHTAQLLVIIRDDWQAFSMQDDTARLPADATPFQADEIRRLLELMPAAEALSGLRFAHNRWTAKDAGVLKVGRKSMIRMEVHSVSAEQARWRLANWKKMIAEYRRKGYSYPSISRIKKMLAEKAAEETPE